MITKYKPARLLWNDWSVTIHKLQPQTLDGSSLPHSGKVFIQELFADLNFTRESGDEL